MSQNMSEKIIFAVLLFYLKLLVEFSELYKVFFNLSIPFSFFLFKICSQFCREAFVKKLRCISIIYIKT